MGEGSGNKPWGRGWRKWSAQIHKDILNVAPIEAGYKAYARWYLVPERLSDHSIDETQTNLVHVERKKNLFSRKYGPPGLHTNRSLIRKAVHLDDWLQIPR